MTNQTKTLGQVLWDAYVHHSGINELSDNTEWEVIPNEDQSAFEQAAQAVIAEYEERKWQPIETAPKDENIEVLLTGYPKYEHFATVCIGNHYVYTIPDNREVWHARELVDEINVCLTPTHWQPLPAPPKEIE